MRRTVQLRPAAYIGVDAPDFNLSIEEKVRASGIPVVHMVAPAVWAWRPQRIHQIKRAVDHLLLIFPFEEKIFKEAGIPSTIHRPSSSRDYSDGAGYGRCKTQTGTSLRRGGHCHSSRQP